jgi:murein L,D-transpeptidase YcbB/YkuD
MTSRRALLAVSCVLVLTDCGWLAHRRSARAERALAIATVFETPHPYSARKLEDRDFARFFAAHPEYRPDSAAIADFYERRNGQSAWMLGDSLSASAESFIAFAGTADSTAPNKPGFSPRLIELYEQSASGNAASACDGCANDLELHLTGEFFRFAARKYGGYLSRDEGELDWFIPRAKKDAGRLLDSLATGKMDLSDYEPIHPQYQLLKRGIERYRLVASEPWPALELPRGKRKLELGDSAGVIGEIRHRLHLLGDLSDDGTGERYDSTMDAAVRSFQARHGVQADGVIGPSALRELNVPVSERLRTILVNIERLRWVPERVPPNVLQVNIPEFRLHVFEDGKEVLGMGVVVGARATHTVVFSDTLTQIVFSPGWILPPSITRKEVLPKVRKDPTYLASHDMEIVGGTSDNPMIRQRPGPRNPLGGVKFLFPNSYDIYMHDTPSQALFLQDDRAGSHGCIRLSHPADLAAYLLRADPQWTAESIRAAMTSGTERTVQLRDTRLVTIGYFTAWVDSDGRLNFRDDVYGHDAKLARELFVQ